MLAPSMKFSDLLNEALDQENWLNLKTDTTNQSEYPDSTFLETSEDIQKLLEEPDLSNIIFISPEFGIGADFLIFDKHIIPNSIDIKDYAVVDGTAINYLHLYKYHDIPFVVAEFRDVYEYGYIFMGKDKFDEINQKIFPKTAGDIITSDGELGDESNQESQENMPQDEEFGENQPTQEENDEFGNEPAQEENDEFGSASAQNGPEDMNASSQVEDFPETKEDKKSHSLLDD